MSARKKIASLKALVTGMRQEQEPWSGRKYLRIETCVGTFDLDNTHTCSEQVALWEFFRSNPGAPVYITLEQDDPEIVAEIASLKKRLAELEAKIGARS